jgi:hypothetical protein
VPRLAPRAGVLEDELRKEAVDPSAEQTAPDVENRPRFDERPKPRVTMEPKDLGDPLFGGDRRIHRPGEVLLGSHDEAVLYAVPTGAAADLHHALEHGLANIPAGKAGDDEESVLVPLLLLRLVDHTYIPVDESRAYSKQRARLTAGCETWEDGASLGKETEMNTASTGATTRSAIASAGFAALLIAGPAHANMILNGDFETNTAIASSYNVPNSSLNTLVSNFTAFGTGNEIDLVTGTDFGIAPQSGSWKIGMNSQVGTPSDAMAFALSSSVLSGSSYDLQIFLAGGDLATLGPVEIGLSSSATSFGTLVYSAAPTSTSAWSQFDTTFVAPTAASFLTLRTASSPDVIYSFVDNVSLELVPEPTTGLLLGIALMASAARRNRSH